MLQKQFLLKILIAVAIVLFWFWIFFQNIVPGGVFKFTYNFTHNPWVAGLRPIERVIDRQTIVGDPIYLDVKLPTHFDYLAVKMDFENKSSGELRLGIFTNKEKWQILFGELKDNEVSFDLRGMSLDKNIIPFVISAPRATENSPVLIKHISFEARKTPLGWNEFKKLLLKPKPLLLVACLLSFIFGFLFLVFFPIMVSTFILISLTAVFLLSAVLEFIRPGTVVNFFDSRIFIILFLIYALPFCRRMLHSKRFLNK